MASEALTFALQAGSADSLLRWLTGQDGLDTDTFTSTRSEFVTYFLCYLRGQTESILQTNTNALKILQHQSTPEKMLNQKKPPQTSGEPPETPDVDNTNASVPSERRRSHESPSKEKSSQSHKKPGRRVKTRLFNENDSQPSSSDRNSYIKQDFTDNNTSGMENMVISSTPMKKLTDFPHLPMVSPMTPSVEVSRNSSRYTSHSDSSKERCDTPRMSHSRHSGRLSSSEKSINLGDYITNATKVSSKKKKSFKTISNDSVSETAATPNLNLHSEDMFPEIGAKRSSRNQSGGKRRIKPTNIDANASTSSKSFTLNSFNSESFQQPQALAFEENAAFKQQKFQPIELSASFNTERTILKEERHKLMEKFNILNTSNSVKKCPVTPQLKVLKADSFEKVQTFVEGDVTKITYREKLEMLADIYNVLLKNNLVLSISAEVYFMISIVLSKQCTEDYELTESRLSLENDNNVLCDFLLKSVHNCSYFAIKTLWMQRNILEVMLDKFSLKLLGENKRVRSFYPDLAKYLLNLYSMKCEGDMPTGREESGVVTLENPLSNSVVCFNSETDNVDNFPSVLSFQNFKKQRDMFYEILRWWSDPVNQSIGSGRTLLRSRVKSLLALAITPANHAHLARLLVAQMMTDCVSSSHESKLSKLQRRLTGAAPTPASAESHRLPRFIGREEFYRDMLMAAESESFRAHVRDSLASELCGLDAGCLPSCDERQDSSAGDVKREYLQCVKRLRLLAKFLGLLVAAPYQPAAADYSSKMFVPAAVKYAAPKEKVLDSEIALRIYSQPPIDLQAMLESALEQNRLSITIPWLILYLAMMDYAGLRIQYFSRLNRKLFRIYTTTLRVPDDNTEKTKKSTMIFLKLCLSWLFELPHFPQESFYEAHSSLQTILTASKLDSSQTKDVQTTILTFNDVIKTHKSDSSIDFVELIDESVLAEVCPYLKEFNALLLTSHPSSEIKDVGSTFRHITPVTMSLNAADRAKNKERELQARLEEELLRTQASSTRRVLELVADRVTSATVKELAGSLLAACRARCRREAWQTVQAWRGTLSDNSVLHHQLKQMYAGQLARLRAAASEGARATVAQRARMALRALLASGAATAPLETVACRASLARVDRWLADNWSDVGILCKDINAEMNHLLMLGEGFLSGLPSESDASDAGARASGACRWQAARLVLPQEHFDATNVSSAELIIDLKDMICQLLEYSPLDLEPPALLERSRVCCRSDNVFVTPTSRRAVLQLTLDLLVVIISRKPLSMTEIILNKFHALWNECCPNRRRNEQINDSVHTEDFEYNPRDFAYDDERMPTPVTSDDEDTEKPVKIIIDTSPAIVDNDRSGDNDGFKLIEVSNECKWDENGSKTAFDRSKAIMNVPRTETKQLKILKKPLTIEINPLKAAMNPLNAEMQLPISELKTSKIRMTSSKFEIDTSKSGMSSPKTEICSPKTGLSSPKTGLSSPKTGLSSPKTGLSSPKTGLSSPKTGLSSPKTGPSSAKIDISSPKTEDTSKTDNAEDGEDFLDLFNRILCPRNIVMLSDTRSKGDDVWVAMANFLVFLLKNDFLSEDSLTEQCVAVYRHDWSQSVLERLSVCMRCVSAQRGRAGGKFTLFLDFLAEFCGDLDLGDAPL